MKVRFFKRCSRQGFLFALLLTTSCQLGPSYKTPGIEAPVHWKNGDVDSSPFSSSFPTSWKTREPDDSPLDNTSPEDDSNDASMESDRSLVEKICDNPFEKPIENWWEIFNDPVLNSLEKQAVESNYSLWSAMERVEQAWALARIIGTARWPLITFDPSFVRSGQLIQNPLIGTTNGVSQQTTAQTTPTTQSGSDAASSLIPRLIRLRNTAYTLPFNFSYEVDLWSRIRNQCQASVLRAEAAQEDYENVLLTLTSDVATNYFQLRGFDTQQLILQKNIESRREAYEINLARFKAGLVVYVDVTRAQEQLAAARADKEDVILQRGLQENILALLTGTPAPIFSIAYAPFSGVPPNIPVGLPAELLYRRPDVKEAERNLAAAYADIGVAYADFYPSLVLTATLGLESPDLAHLFSWQARLWEIGANMMQTIFNAGRNSANLRYYISLYQQALDNYQQQVLIAFKEVEDALISIKQRALQGKELEIAVVASRQTLNLSRIRYNQGLVNYLDVSESERDVLNSEINSAVVLTQRYLSAALLVKALGGGWEPVKNEQDKTAEQDSLENAFESDCP